MPRHTHPRGRATHSRAHIREQRVRHIRRYRRLLAVVWGWDWTTEDDRVTPVRNPLTTCSCELCSNRTLRRADRRHERQATRRDILRKITEHAGERRRKPGEGSRRDESR